MMKQSHVVFIIPHATTGCGFDVPCFSISIIVNCLDYPYFKKKRQPSILYYSYMKNMKTQNIVLHLLVFILTCTLVCFAQNVQPHRLKAGAAKVNITPDKGNLPKNYLGVYDSIYCRTIVLDNGTTSAAFITADVGMLREPLWKKVTQRIEKELGIPAINVLLTATHTHSVPFTVGGETLEQQIVASVKEAQVKLQPARIGYGTGVSYINVNRNIIDPQTRRWWEGPNYDGPSDKTVAVVRFESLDGTPIAVYYNYAMHAVILGQLDMVSGDVPGAASRYIEDSFDNKIVALWSTGAEGDQNPIYFQQTYDLRDIRIKEYAKRGEDISNSMPPGGTGLDRNDHAVASLMNQQKVIAQSMGVFLGEEVKHVMRNINRTEATATITAAQKMLTLPGRNRSNSGRAGYPGTYTDGDSVSIRIGVLLVDDIAFATVNGEVFNPIAQQLKKESPFARTMMITATNGSANSGYIPNDAAFGSYTFEVLSSRLKPGYAERAIINGLLDIMDKLK
jgi:neutral ceramidase